MLDVCIVCNDNRDYHDNLNDNNWIVKFLLSPILMLNLKQLYVISNFLHRHGGFSNEACYEQKPI